MLWVAHIITLVNIRVPVTELLDHRPSLICTSGLRNELAILHLTRLLQTQVSALLPLLVHIVVVLHHDILLRDLLA